MAIAPHQANAAACSNSDVSLTIGATTYTADQCAPISVSNGNLSTDMSALNAALNASNPAFTSYLDSGRSGPDVQTSTIIDGIQISLSAVSQIGSTNSYSWTLSWSDTNGATADNLPIQLSLIMGIYGGSNEDGYRLDNVVLPSDLLTGSGSFAIVFTAGNGKSTQNPGLSHLDLLIGNVQAVTEIPSNDTTSTPEPASLALIGSALVGMGAARRRRRKA
jgi:hypothetical protein